MSPVNLRNTQSNKNQLIRSSDQLIFITICYLIPQMRVGLQYVLSTVLLELYASILIPSLNVIADVEIESER